MINNVKNKENIISEISRGEGKYTLQGAHMQKRITSDRGMPFVFTNRRKEKCLIFKFYLGLT